MNGVLGPGPIRSRSSSSTDSSRLLKVPNILVNEQEIANFGETMKVLDDFFVPIANAPFEGHFFRQIAQAADETVNQFENRLRQQVGRCDLDVLWNLARGRNLTFVTC